MLKERIKKIYLYRHTLRDMTISQFKAKYAGSKLGIWWAMISPLILALSINFVFTSIFKINIPNYAIFVLAGIMPWFFATNALTEATNSFVISSPILKQGTFPREFIPISFILANLLNFLLGLVFLFPLFIILNFRIIKFLLFLFPIIIFHLLFIMGMGFLFSLVNVFFRDLSLLLPTVFMVWFWITPVFYSLDMLSFPFRWICLFNPMSYYIILYQNILFHAQTPSLSLIFTACFISLLFFLLGYLVFIKKEAMLLKRI